MSRKSRGWFLSRSSKPKDKSEEETMASLDLKLDLLCCHKVQDSLLSSASRFTDYRGIFNWCVIMLVLTHAHLFLENFIQHGFLVDLRKVLRLLVEDGYNWPSVYLILVSNVFVATALLIEKWQEQGFLSQRTGWVLEAGNLLVLMVFPTAVILHKSTSISVVGSLLSLCFYTVLTLKIYSYHDVNSWYRQGQVGNSGSAEMKEEQEDCPGRREYRDCLTLKDLYYFLMAPTLCYQLNFPRTRTIRKNFLFQRLLEMLILIQLMVGIAQQWIGPIIQRSECTFTNMDTTAKIEHLMELVAPNHFLWLILFYLLSHSCLNFIAELLCFGDREFYGDWWNADNLKAFWSKWNIPFHKWCSRHLYRPLLRRRLAPQHAELAVFVMSAAMCEVPRPGGPDIHPQLSPPAQNKRLPHCCTSADVSPLDLHHHDSRDQSGVLPGALFHRELWQRHGVALHAPGPSHRGHDLLPRLLHPEQGKLLLDAYFTTTLDHQLCGKPGRLKASPLEKAMPRLV
ncbi:diacylglycerol O-acyltransferase 1-like isoform X1 [Lepisosteus oculatus]|uniref:diacylglycerol O-acyltransferase 1-like isoform X1 n=1 Tax=Lepisosteus oculatus TaxID=7918 RepID=UPI0035F4FFBE